MRHVVQADQAAGLRSRQLRHDPRVISLINTPTDFAPRLAQALVAHNQKVLLVDSLGRHAHSSKTHFIFGWQQQLVQQGLQTLPAKGVQVMHAPGSQAGDTMIVRAGSKYHVVLFDACELHPDIALESGTPQTLLLALNAHAETLENAYALIKALHQHKLDWRVLLIGEATLAERVMAAVAYFLPAQSGLIEHINLEADAHLHALAARISAAVSGTRPFDNNAGGEYAQHG